MVQRGTSGSTMVHLGPSKDIIRVISESERGEDVGYEHLILFILSGIKLVKSLKKEQYTDAYPLLRHFNPNIGRGEERYMEARGDWATFLMSFINPEDFGDNFSDDEYDDFLDNIDTYACVGAQNKKRLRAGKLQKMILEFLREDRTPKNRLDDLRFLKCILFGVKNKDWYHDTPKVFRRLLPAYGIKDIDLFTQLFAITSAHTNFQANVGTAARVYHMFERGQTKFNGEGFLPAIVKMLEDFRVGKMDFGAEPPRDGRRKIVNFGRALLGDKDAVVCDIWLLEAFWIAEYYKWKDKVNSYTPRVYEYDAVEAIVREMARQTKLEPRQIVSMAWAGARILMGKHTTHNTEQVVRRALEPKK